MGTEEAVSCRHRNREACAVKHYPINRSAVCYKINMGEKKINPNRLFSLCAHCWIHNYIFVHGKYCIKNINNLRFFFTLPVQYDLKIKAIEKECNMVFLLKTGEKNPATLLFVAGLLQFSNEIKTTYYL